MFPEMNGMFDIISSISGTKWKTISVAISEYSVLTFTSKIAAYYQEILRVAIRRAKEF